VLVVFYPSVDVSESKGRLCQQPGNDKQIRV
jgi:hypothetical protein